MYTERFSECWELAGTIEAASYSAEQNTGRIDMSPYTRAFIAVVGETGTGNAVDVDFEQANAATGGTVKALDSGNKDVTLADGEAARGIEIRGEEFDTNNAFGWLNVEATPAGARVVAVQVYGLVKKAPADTSNWDGITD